MMEVKDPVSLFYFPPIFFHVANSSWKLFQSFGKKDRCSFWVHLDVAHINSRLFKILKHQCYISMKASRR